MAFSSMINTEIREELHRRLVDFVFRFKLIMVLLVLALLIPLHYVRFLPIETGPPIRTVLAYSALFPVYWFIRSRQREWLLSFNILSFFVDILVVTFFLHYFGGIYSIVWWAEYPFLIAVSGIFMTKRGRTFYTFFTVTAYSMLFRLEHADIIARVDLFGIPVSNRLDLFCYLSTMILIVLAGIVSNRIVDIIVDLQQFAHLGRLSAEMAHEIRTPLQIIEGVVQRTACPEPAQREIKAQTERISRFIKEILALGREELQNPSTVRLEAIVNHAINLVFQVADPAKAITLEKEFCGEDVLVHVDIDQTTKALSNILRNAIDAIETEGKILVRIHREGFDWVKVEIQDTGEGILRSELKRVFEPFHTTKTGMRGVGLGLAVARKFIQANGGGIDVVSEKGKGSKFTIKLPVHVREGAS